MGCSLRDVTYEDRKAFANKRHSKDLFTSGKKSIHATKYNNKQKTTYTSLPAELYGSKVVHLKISRMHHRLSHRATTPYLFLLSDGFEAPKDVIKFLTLKVVTQLIMGTS